MTRMYKILPDIDDDFHPSLGFVMFIMAIIMITSLFSYRSLLQTLVMIYVSYLALTFKNPILNYIGTTFKSVSVPFNTKSSVSDDECYEEGDEDSDKKDSDNEDIYITPINLDNDSDEHNESSKKSSLRKRTTNPFSHDTI